MTDEERVVSCQKEIKRLRSVVREYEDDIQAYRAVISKSVAFMKRMGKSDEQICELLNVSSEYLNEISE